MNVDTVGCFSLVNCDGGTTSVELDSGGGGWLFSGATACGSSMLNINRSAYNEAVTYNSSGPLVTCSCKLRTARVAATWRDVISNEYRISEVNTYGGDHDRRRIEHDVHHRVQVHELEDAHKNVAQKAAEAHVSQQKPLIRMIAHTQ